MLWQSFADRPATAWPWLCSDWFLALSSPTRHAAVRQIVAAAATSIRTASSTPAFHRPSHDELDELGAAFNAMLDKEQASFAPMRESMDNVAHDFARP